MNKMKIFLLITLCLTFLFQNVYSIPLDEYEREALQTLRSGDADAADLEEAMDAFSDFSHIPAEVVEAFVIAFEEIDFYSSDGRDLLKKFIEVTYTWGDYAQIGAIYDGLLSSSDFLLNAFVLIELDKMPRLRGQDILPKAVDLLSATVGLKRGYGDQVTYIGPEFYASQTEKTMFALNEIFEKLDVEVAEYEVQELVLIAAQLTAMEVLRGKTSAHKDLLVLEYLVDRTAYEEVRERGLEVLRTNTRLNLYEFRALQKEVNQPVLVEYLNMRIGTGLLESLFVKLHIAYIETHARVQKAKLERSSTAGTRGFQALDLIRGPERSLASIGALEGNYAKTMTIIRSHEVEPSIVLGLALDLHLTAFKASYPGQALAFARANAKDLADSCIFLLEAYKSGRAQFLALDILHRFLLVDQVILNFVPINSSDGADRLQERRWNLEAERVERLLSALEAVVAIKGEDISYQADLILRQLKGLSVHEGIRESTLGELRYLSLIDSIALRLEFWGPEVFSMDLGLAGFEIGSALILLESLEQSELLQNIPIEEVSRWASQFLKASMFSGEALSSNTKKSFRVSAEKLLRVRQGDMVYCTDETLKTLVTRSFGVELADDLFVRGNWDADRSLDFRTRSVEELSLPKAEEIAPHELDARTVAAERGMDRVIEELAERGEPVDPALERAREALRARGEGYGKGKPGEKAGKK
ncbi:MAG: hypothetical protein ABIA04_02540 [Pseudomonadota bacterium]